MQNNHLVQQSVNHCQPIDMIIDIRNGCGLMIIIRNGCEERKKKCKKTTLKIF